MPYYDYECPRCGTFELKQSISEPAITHHDVCGEPVERTIAPVAFTLKGDGWSRDGYKGSSKMSASDGPSCSPGGCDRPTCAAKMADA
ncbi:MAG: zinc ribbon domain-containing protein [Deltaproteobacteria bacterium]|nr:zinc ribbon domain-containing protein [Deltaproteobacteria bacterium]